MKYVSFTWPALEAALSIFNVTPFVKIKKKLKTSNKKNLHQCRITPFEKRPTCKNPACVSVYHEVAKRLYLIDMYDNGQEMCYL
jgi:hypothetical protein